MTLVVLESKTGVCDSSSDSLGCGGCRRMTTFTIDFSVSISWNTQEPEMSSLETWTEQGHDSRPAFVTPSILVFTLLLPPTKHFAVLNSNACTGSYWSG